MDVNAKLESFIVIKAVKQYAKIIKWDIPETVKSQFF